jgi:hypothetical protein
VRSLREGGVTPGPLDERATDAGQQPVFPHRGVANAMPRNAADLPATLPDLSAPAVLLRSPPALLGRWLSSADRSGQHWWAGAGSHNEFGGQVLYRRSALSAVDEVEDEADSGGAGLGGGDPDGGERGLEQFGEPGVVDPDDADLGAGWSSLLSWLLRVRNQVLGRSRNKV